MLDNLKKKPTVITNSDMPLNHSIQISAEDWNKLTKKKRYF